MAIIPFFRASGTPIEPVVRLSKVDLQVGDRNIRRKIRVRVNLANRLKYA
ncbi:hypothetical protein FXW07_13240 [Methanosarcina sp. DH1]|nr:MULTISPECIES: hypothetical protein [unclassified Methanosarcina]MCC4767541.1 hypothetical protein [Methanosarcina sp. DH1]